MAGFKGQLRRNRCGAMGLWASVSILCLWGGWPLELPVMAGAAVLASRAAAGRLAALSVRRARPGTAGVPQDVWLAEFGAQWGDHWVWG